MGGKCRARTADDVSDGYVELSATVSGEGILDLPKHLEMGESGHVSDAIRADSVAQTCKALADESTW
jgi:hypothetical protein